MRIFTLALFKVFSLSEHLYIPSSLKHYFTNEGKMNLFKKTLLAAGLLASTSIAADRAMIGIGIDIPLTGFDSETNDGTFPLHSGNNIYLNVHANPQFVMVAGLGYGSESVEEVASKTTTTNSVFDRF